MLLIAFSQASPANTLAAFLNKTGIECKLVQKTSLQGQQEFQIHLLREDAHDEASKIVQQFLQNPNHPDFLDVAWQQGAPANLVYANGLSLNQLLGHLLSVPFTSAVVAVALLIHLSVFVFGQFQIFDSLSFQSLPLVVNNGEVWRLITPTVMHFSALHLAFNLMWWFWLGRSIERKLGISFLFIAYLTIGLISNYSQFIVSGENFGGLSGVVYGLLGFCWWFGRLRPSFGISVPNSIVGFMLIWLVIGFLDILWINMANTAHLTGLLTGCGIAFSTHKLFK